MRAIPGTGGRVETRVYLLLNDLDTGSGTLSSYLMILCHKYYINGFTRKCRLFFQIQSHKIQFIENINKFWSQVLWRWAILY